MEINSLLREEINKSIKECENHTNIHGSSDFFESLIAKYSALDKSFADGLTISNIYHDGGEDDYRPGIRAVSEKLKMLLLMNSTEEDIQRQKFVNQINKLISVGESILKEDLSDDYYEYEDPIFSGPRFSKWIIEVELFSEKHIKTHYLYKGIAEKFKYKRYAYGSVEHLINCLKVIAEDEDFKPNIVVQMKQKDILSPNALNQAPIKTNTSGKIFLVHGHDNEMKQDVARFLEKAKLNAVILHEQPNGGMTIIEKFEKYTDVSFAIVLYSPCDVGRSKKAKPEDEKPRARQNVVFEHGYLNGRLGRDRVCALLKDDVEKPSDIEGVLYIHMDDRGAWKSEVAREMKKAGLDFNLEALL